MKINSKLLKAAGFNPTKKTYQISIQSICEKVENKEITLPLYQRDVSWNITKAVELLNYQLLGKAPVSPISINEINTEEYVPQISIIDREIIPEVEKGQLSIADGQQRITTNYKCYINHSDFRNIVLDIVKGSFIVVEDSIKKHQIPVGILLNKDMSVFFDYMNNNSTLKKPEAMNLLMQVRNKIRDYNYTINLAEDLTEDEQIEWFEVLNNAGSRVTRIQMRFSKLKVNNIDIYVQYTKPFRYKIESAGIDVFKVKDTEVSIPVAALNPSYEVVMERIHTPNFTPIPSDTRENQLCSMTNYQLEKCFELTLNALDKALDFIEENNLKLPNRIDYITYLVGLFVFKGDNELSKVEKENIIDWYMNVKFTNKSNSDRRKIFTDLLEIVGITSVNNGSNIKGEQVQWSNI